MSLTIGRRLAFGFGFVLVVLAALAVFEIATLVDLAAMQDESARRADDAVFVVHAADTGPELYMIIADGVINRDLPQTDADYAAAKKAIQEQFAELGRRVDTEAERAWHAEATAVLAEVFGLWESRLRPLLATTDAVTPAMRDLDDLIDQALKRLRAPIEKIVESLRQEQLEADRDFDTDVSFAVLLSVVLSAVGVLSGVLLAWLIARRVTRPILATVDLALKLAEGDLRVVPDPKLLAMKDEAGDLARAMQRMIGDLSSIVSDVLGSTVLLSEGSRQLAASAEQMSQGATEQAASAEEVGSSMEQMGANIRQNADNSKET